MEYKITPEEICNDYESGLPKIFRKELDEIYDENCSQIDSNTQPEQIYKSIDILWKQLINLSREYSIIDFDDEVSESLKYEIISELLSELTVCTSPQIKGINNFLKVAEHFGYTEKASALPALREWLPMIIEKEYFYPPSVGGNFTFTQFLDDHTEVPASLRDYFHSHITVNTTKATNQYSFKKYGAYLTNGLLRFFEEKAALYPSKNYLAYNFQILSCLFDTLHEMYCTHLKKPQAIEKILFCFHAEELFHFSYFIYGFDFLSSIYKPNMSTHAQLILIKDFFYTYKFTYNISSEVIKLHYLKLFCKEPQKYFSYNNGITAQYPEDVHYKICFAEYITLPFIKNSFRYWLYLISQNDKLVYLNKTDAPKKDTADPILTRLFKLILDYMQSEHGKVYIDKSILNNSKFIETQGRDGNSDFNAFIFHLSQIYCADPNLLRYFSCDKGECITNLDILHDIKRKHPDKVFPKELLKIKLEPCLEYISKTVYSDTFPYNKEYMNYLFFTTYPRLT